MAFPGTWSEEDGEEKRHSDSQHEKRCWSGASLEQDCISEHMREILKINNLIYFSYKISGNSKLK